ncbi:MAG: hypothetical protein ACKO1L_13780, partial [Brachymonas sp.]
LVAQPVALREKRGHLRQRDDAMRQIGREARDGTVQRIAAASVGAGSDGSQALLGSLPRGRKFLHAAIVTRWPSPCTTPQHWA